MARANVYRLSVQGAGRRDVTHFSRAQRQLQDALNDELRKIARIIGGARFHSIISGQVPQDTGAMLDNIRGVFYTRAGRIQVTVATAPRDEAGYNYVPVTRFGHRKRVIRPKRKGGALKVRTEGHRFEESFDIRRSVRGVRVPSPALPRDWVEDIRPAFEALNELAAKSLARKDYSRVFRGRSLR